MVLKGALGLTGRRAAALKPGKGGVASHGGDPATGEFASGLCARSCRRRSAQAFQFCADRPERAKLMLLFAEPICIRTVGRIDRLVQKIREIPFKVGFMGPRLRDDERCHVPGILASKKRTSRSACCSG